MALRRGFPKGAPFRSAPLADFFGYFLVQHKKVTLPYFNYNNLYFIDKLCRNTLVYTKVFLLGGGYADRGVYIKRVPYAVNTQESVEFILKTAFTYRREAVFML